MKCVFCGFEESKVIDSRSTEDSNSIRRRRECLKCGKRFTTYETVESVPILVIKSNGSRQPFDVQKIKRGIIKACEKRPITLSQIEDVVTGIEKKITNSLDQEVSSNYIGELVMEGLKPLDEIAYVRFAAVYRKFKDISMFKTFINEI
ncbi:MAG: transcriptional regulator NrdR [Christensenellaceae bacterium]|jgi:transcriptional repressor NrdR|nr:transcriptional regulator NrdR [Christensenellaceae bacterium]